ncbi:MAG: excinuclease ABC subunit UvrB [Candidatus Uhrbacteria bacterium]|nr:excinuclease ABC subunit UvrB [Candidatus Uhrbacteria bacterium]
MQFKLKSKFKPSGDQPKAIKDLTDGINKGLEKQTLLGVTGSGKTFTIANVIQNVQKPTLVVAPNKTLAAQLCNEFREFFPDSAVEYFVSYYDYYQPEAYMPRSDTYIEKEAQINDEIDRLRHAATQALLSRRDVIIVASVSCIYGLGSPKEYQDTVLNLKIGDDVDRTSLIRRMIAMYFERTNADVDRGQFRSTGDVIEVMPKSGHSAGDENQERGYLYRIVLEDGKVAEIFLLDPITRKIKDRLKDFWLFPAKHYVVAPGGIQRALKDIEMELKDRLAELKDQGKILEVERLKRRTRYDIEMIRNVGYCNGIENYSRHFDGRKAGQPADSLLAYFPDDFLCVIDESHVTVPQLRGMFAGDRSRKNTLIEHGFRLPSARDNRPLMFDEFEKQTGQTIYVSATPADFERTESDLIVEQIVRPTGLIDPEVIICPVTGTFESEKSEISERERSKHEQLTARRTATQGSQVAIKQAHYDGQVEDLIVRIKDRVTKKERALVTTLTKKMAEDLTGYLLSQNIKVQYIHSDVSTFDRIEILTDLRKGVYDVVVGVNLLREGLDLPEVSLVAILDADKEGFLRSETSLVQTIGRAARNINGQVILYADKMTGSLERALMETGRRREIQVAYNKKHKITPKSIKKNIGDIREMLGGDADKSNIRDILKIELSAEPHEIEAVIAEKEDEMKKAARKLMFETAALLRDEIAELTKELKQKRKKAAPTPEHR